MGCRRVGAWRFLGVLWRASPGDLLMDWAPRSLRDAAGVPCVWAGCKQWCCFPGRKAREEKHEECEMRVMGL